MIPYPASAITPRQAIAWGFSALPLRKRGERKAPRDENWQTRTYHPTDWKRGEGIGLRAGRQRDGTYLNIADFDHHPERGIDALHYFQTTLDRLQPASRIRLFTARSTGGQGRYILFRTRHALPKGYLRNERGDKIGDFLGVGAQVVLPTPDRWLQNSLAEVPLLDEAEVTAICAALNYQPEAFDIAPALRLDWNVIEHNYGNISGLLRRIQPHTLTYKQLHGDGEPDRSHMRFGLACELRRRYGFPDEEIAALLFHFHFGHLEERGTKRLQADIERCIARANEKYPEVLTNRSRCLQAKAVEPFPHVDRPRRGRRTRITPETYLAALKRRAIGANHAVMLTQQELAHTLKVSVPTIRRLEAQLREQRHIERRVVRQGKQSYSYVVILSAIINTAEAPPAVRSSCAETSQQKATNYENTVLKEEHTSVSVPPAEPDPAPAPSVAVRVDDAAGAVFAAVAAAGRVTYKRFAATFNEYFPHITITEKYLHVVYARVQATQRRERAVEQEAVKLRAAMASDLRRMARGYARKSVDARKRGAAKEAYMWGCKAQQVEQEIAHRQAIGNWPAERHRCTVRPLPPLLACAEPEPAPPNNDEGLSGGVCSSQQVAVVVPAVEEPLGVKWDYLMRLFARNDVSAIERHCRLYQASYAQVCARLEMMEPSV